MAKNLIEKLTKTHSLTVNGVFDYETMSIEIEEVGVLTLQDLMVNFNEKQIKLSIQSKNEEEIEI